MSLATIFLLLQTAISLLASSIGASPAVQQQAIAFSNQAIVIANEALLAPATTTLQDTVTTSTPPAFPQIATSTPQIAAKTTDNGVGSGPAPVTAATTTQMQPKKISVSFVLKGDDGFATITNDTGTAVRVKNLSAAGGVIAGVTIGNTYGQGFVYAESFTDSLGKTFDMFTCTGLGSLGQASLPGGNIDPCARKDASGLAKNDLQPGEVMIIRYVKSGKDNVSAPVHQVGSIVEAGTGNDVTF